MDLSLSSILFLAFFMWLFSSDISHESTASSPVQVLMNQLLQKDLLYMLSSLSPVLLLPFTMFSVWALWLTLSLRICRLGNNWRMIVAFPELFGTAKTIKEVKVKDYPKTYKRKESHFLIWAVLSVGLTQTIICLVLRASLVPLNYAVKHEPI